MQTGLLRPAAGKRVELWIDVADDVWPVLADVDQLCAALLNLVANARQPADDYSEAYHKVGFAWK